ncbi:hypothetical protein RUM43_002856 [Polyplax serrata]|uniref:WW domain-containing protein n=1 Tax=Polyplax serrata TaxID=468196 RepID=A0AAN8NU93_POLSC
MSTKINKKTVLPSGWVKAVSKRNPNRHYYYNTITKESTWTNPNEDSTYQLSSANIKSLNSKARNKKSKLPINDQAHTIKVEPNIEIEDYDDMEDEYYNSITKAANEHAKNVPNSVRKLGLKSKCSEEVKPTMLSSSAIKVKSVNSKVLSSDIGNLKQESKERLSSKNSSALNLIKTNYTQKPNSDSKTCSSTREEKLQEILQRKAKKRARQKNKKKQKISMAQGETTSVGSTITNELLKDMGKNDQSGNIPKKTIHDQEQSVRGESTIIGKESSISQQGTNISRSSCNDHLFKESENDQVEEMDWEPYNEEVAVKNINEACQKMDCTKQNSSSLYCELNMDVALPQQSNSGILVLDTNVLISCLNFIKDLIETNIQNLGFPIVYIPWRVLQELDHLKNYKMRASDGQLQVNARQAILYLNENFKCRHPRLFGQSFDDYSRIMVKDTSVADDEILQTCIQLTNDYFNMKVILITNDKNLESKANISNVEAYSKEGFQKKYLNFNSDSHIQRSNVGREYSSAKENIDGADTENTAQNIINILKEKLSVVLETEMKMAFDSDWIKICYKKPPWTLKDILDCFKKHWRSVFFLVFNKEVLQNIEDISSNIQFHKGDPRANLDSLIKIAHKLLISTKDSLRQERLYSKDIDNALSKLSLLSKEKSTTTPQVNNCVEQSECSVGQSSECVVSSQPEFQCNSFSEDFNEIKDLFSDNISKALSTPIANSNLCVPETRLNLMHRYNEIMQLILFIERVIELPNSDINVDSLVLNNLSNFLKQSIPTLEPKLQINLTKCLVVFFLNPEGRLLLSRSLNDFREFSQTLLNANDLIERTLKNT